MIPITSETTFYPEKATQLTQGLLDLRDNENVDISEDISQSIDAILAAQQKLVRQIDDYINNHKPLQQSEEDKFKTVSKIVETYPDFLATKDQHGMIPCHYKAINSKKHSKYLELYTKIGVKHGIGGRDGRGGLLVTDNRGHNALHFLNDPQVFEMLREMDPPLFYIEDVKKYNLLQNAIVNHGEYLVKYFCDIFPSYLYQLDEGNKLPIHHAIIAWWQYFKDDADPENNYFKYLQETVSILLRKSLTHPISYESIGGLFTKIENGVLVIDYLVDKFGNDRTWELVENALSSSNFTFPLLIQTIKQAPKHCAEVIQRFPDSVYARDKDRRLPIYVALESGMRWSISLLFLLTASQAYLKDVDPVTKLPPFVLAGTGTSCELKTIYGLVRKYPDHVEILAEYIRNAK